MAYRTAVCALALLLVVFAVASVAGVSLPTFPNSPWTVDVSGATPDANSDAIVAWCHSQSACFGVGRLQTDFSIHFLEADCDTPRVPHTEKPGYYSEACDSVSFVPMPAQGALEGQTTWSEGSSCSGDCHLLVYDTDANRLYELFDTSVTTNGAGVPTAVTSLCAIVWDTTFSYGANGRGDGCTSADAAGFPISTLLFTPEEVQAGAINHAIRFTLPNANMRALSYRHPASHFGGPSSTNANSVRYGSLFRLKASFDESGFSASERVVLTALKTYGMYLSDGGNIPLIGMNDLFSPVKWSDVGITSQSFNALRITDFDLMPGFGSNPDIGPLSSRPDCVLDQSTPSTPNCQTSSGPAGTGPGPTGPTNSATGTTTTTTTTSTSSTGSSSQTSAAVTCRCGVVGLILFVCGLAMLL